jgi:hypothetical protein
MNGRDSNYYSTPENHPDASNFTSSDLIDRSSSENSASQFNDGSK